MTSPLEATGCSHTANQYHLKHHGERQFDRLPVPPLPPRTLCRTQPQTPPRTLPQTLPSTPPRTRTSFRMSVFVMLLPFASRVCLRQSQKSFHLYVCIFAHFVGVLPCLHTHTYTGGGAWLYPFYLCEAPWLELHLHLPLLRQGPVLCRLRKPTSCPSCVSWPRRNARSSSRRSGQRTPNNRARVLTSAKHPGFDSARSASVPGVTQGGADRSLALIFFS